MHEGSKERCWEKTTADGDELEQANLSLWGPLQSSILTVGMVPEL